MNKRQLIGVLGILLFGGAPLAYALLTASFSDTVWQTPTMKSDVYYVGAGTIIANSTGLYGAEIYRNGETLATYVASLGVGSTITTVSPYDYIVFRDGATYYANSTTGDTNYNNADFDAMMDILYAALAGTEASIYLKTGTYVCDDTIDGVSGVSLFGAPGSVIDASTRGTGSVIAYTGTIGSSEALTVNSLQGDDSLDVADSSAFAAGDLCFIRSTDDWFSNSLTQNQGEFFYAGSVPDGTSVDLRQHDRLLGNYTVAATGTVYKVTPVADFTIDGITIIGDGADQLYGITVTYGVNVNIKNCNFKDVYSHSIWFTSVINSRITENYVKGSSKAGLGYGVDMEYACTNILVNNNNFEDCRHSVTIGGGTGYGIPRGIVVDGNTAMSSTEDANYDCHAVGEDIVFSNNISTNGEYGIAFQGYTGKLIGNNIHSAEVQGIRINNANTRSVVVAFNGLNECTTGIRVENGYKVHLIYNDFFNCGTNISDGGTSTETVSLS